MPNWKKVVVSGSDALLNSVTASFTGSLTGALIGTASWATNAINAQTSSVSETTATVRNTNNANFFPTFVDSNNSTKAYELIYTSPTIAFNPATATLGVDNISASSIITTNGFTGSLQGTASWAVSASQAITASRATSASYALTASFALNGGGGAAFPYTGSALITGSLGVTGSVSITQNLTASRAYISSSNGTISGSSLIVYGSGSSQPVFTVQGSQGELFSITDSLSGSLFSVNDISGLPILEVFSDNTTLIGDYQDPMLITTKKVTMTNSGSFVIYSLPTASYDTAFFDYSIKSGSNARAGQIMAIQSGSSVNFTETTTTDFGSTTAVSFTVLVSGSNMVLTGSAATGSWTIKSIIRGI